MLKVVGGTKFENYKNSGKQPPQVKSIVYIGKELMQQRISTLDFSIKNSKFEKLKASKEQVKDYKLDVGKALKFNIAFNDEKEKRTNSNIGCV